MENIGDGVKGLGKSAGGIKNSSKVGISNAERVKFKNWEYPPSGDLYLKYKNVYDNPKYYNQETGALSWPPNNGFVKGTEKVDILKPGTIIDRYGEPTGEFLAPMGDSYPSRALAPHSETSKHYVYEVIEDLEITSGEIAPWFDQPGGKAKIGANNDYFGASLKGNVSLAKDEGSLVLGSDNSNGYAKGKAGLLSADGHVEFEFEEDSFAIGLGGGASGANASFELGLSFLEYEQGDTKGNLFGVAFEPKLDAGASANISLSGEKAMSWGPVDINAINLNVGGSFGLGLNVNITLPIPSLNLGWGI